MPSVAITGGKRSRAIRTPLTAPMAAPIASRIGTARIGLPSGVPSSSVTRMMLMKPISGAIDRSMPPPPLRNAGVLAIPAIANGASVPRVSGSCPPVTNLGSAMTLAAKSATPRTMAKAAGRPPPGERCSLVILPAEVTRDQPRARELVARKFAEQLVFPEDHDPVHELDRAR